MTASSPRRAEVAPDPREIARRFWLGGEISSVRPHGNGHINTTFRVETLGARAFILQRINGAVFRDPGSLMANLGRVTRHLRARLEAEGASDLDRRVLSLVPSLEGRDYVLDEAGGYWRCFPFIEGVKERPSIESPQQAFEIARAFGNFQRLLSDLPGEPLHPSIPHFHDAGRRFDALTAAVESDVLNRANQAVPEIRFAFGNRPLSQFFAGFIARGEMNERITHNDTKLDNLLFDAASGEALCVIDLDTVMPGLALYDFGDLARSAACTALEDERNLDRVRVDPRIFGALAQGFIEGTGGSLSTLERENLVGATQVFAFTLGVRFLTDFLEGDSYFRIHREGHNLDRARAQFALLRDLQEQEEALRSVLTA